MKKIVIIAQARMGSTRLPGKVLKEVQGNPLLWYLTKRIEEVKTPHTFVIATGSLEKNKKIIDFTKNVGCEYFLGNEDDVLDRYYQAAKHFKADVIVRITADCPLLDPNMIDYGLEIFLNGDYDYVSNGHPPTFPDGYDIEIFSFATIKTAWEEAKLPSEREHVTSYIWKHQERFKLGNFEHDTDLSKFRLTVDTPEDFELISKIFENFYDDYINIRLDDVMKFLSTNPELLKINKQYDYNEGYLKSLEEDKKFLEEKENEYNKRN